jgi:hypothetical protein
MICSALCRFFITNPFRPTGPGWILSYSLDQFSGRGSVKARIVDLAGNLSDYAEPVSVTVDDTIPDQFIPPRLEQGWEATSVKFTSLVIVGTSARGTLQAVDQNGNLLGTVESLGGFYRIPTGSLSEGTYHVVVKHIDQAGHETDLSAGFDVVIDRTSPSAPVAPAMNISLTGGTTTPTTTNVPTPYLSGTAAPNALVQIYEGTVVIGSVVANSSGNYSVQLRSLTAGSHTVTAKAIDGAGNVSDASPSFSFTVNATSFIAGIVGQAAGVEGQTVALSATYSQSPSVPGYTYQWQVGGDVTGITGATTSSFSFVPLNNGNYTVQLTVKNGSNITVTTSLQVAVAAAQASMDDVMLMVNSSGGYTFLTGEISAVSATEVFSVRVDWGDGTVNTYGNQLRGAFSFPHDYSTAPPAGQGYPVSIELIDEDGNRVATTVQTLTDFKWPELPSGEGGPIQPSEPTGPSGATLPQAYHPIAINPAAFSNLVNSQDGAYWQRVQEINTSFSQQIEAVNAALNSSVSNWNNQINWEAAVARQNELLDYSEHPNPYLQLADTAAEAWSLHNQAYSSEWNAINNAYDSAVNDATDPSPDTPGEWHTANDAIAEANLVREKAVNDLQMRYARIGQQARAWTDQQYNHAQIAYNSEYIKALRLFVESFTEGRVYAYRRAAQAEYERNVALATAEVDRDKLLARLIYEETLARTTSLSPAEVTFQSQYAQLVQQRNEDLADAKRELAVANAEDARTHQMELAPDRIVDLGHVSSQLSSIRDFHLSSLSHFENINKIALDEVFNAAVAESWKKRADDLSDKRKERQLAINGHHATRGYAYESAANTFNNNGDWEAYNERIIEADRTHELGMTDANGAAFVNAVAGIDYTYQLAVAAADQARAEGSAQIEISTARRNAEIQTTIDQELIGMSRSDQYSLDIDWKIDQANNQHAYEGAVADINRDFGIDSAQLSTTSLNNSLLNYFSTYIAWAQTQNTATSDLMLGRLSAEISRRTFDVGAAYDSITGENGSLAEEHALAMVAADEKRDLAIAMANAMLQLRNDLNAAGDDAEIPDTSERVYAGNQEYVDRMIKANKALRVAEANATYAHRTSTSEGWVTFRKAQINASADLALGDINQETYNTRYQDAVEAYNDVLTEKSDIRAETLSDARQAWENTRASAVRRLETDLGYREIDGARYAYEYRVAALQDEADAVERYELAVTDAQAEHDTALAEADRHWTNVRAATNRTLASALQGSANSYANDLLQAQVGFDQQASDEYADALATWATNQGTPHTRYLADMARAEADYQIAIGPDRLALENGRGLLELNLLNTSAAADEALINATSQQDYEAQIDLIEAEQDRVQAMATARKEHYVATYRAEAAHTMGIQVSQLQYELNVSLAYITYQSSVTTAQVLWAKAIAEASSSYYNGYNYGWYWVPPADQQAANEAQDAAIKNAESNRVQSIGSAAQNRATTSGKADLAFVDAVQNARLSWLSNSSDVSQNYSESIVAIVGANLQENWQDRVTYEKTIASAVRNDAYATNALEAQYGRAVNADAAARFVNEAEAALAYFEAQAGSDALAAASLASSQGTSHTAVQSLYAGAYEDWIEATGPSYLQLASDLALHQQQRADIQINLQELLANRAADRDLQRQIGTNGLTGYLPGYISAARNEDLAKWQAEGERMIAYSEAQGTRDLAIARADGKYAHDYVVTSNDYSLTVLNEEIAFEKWKLDNPNATTQQNQDRQQQVTSLKQAEERELKTELGDAGIEWINVAATAESAQVSTQVAADMDLWRSTLVLSYNRQLAQNAIDTFLTVSGNTADTASRTAIYSSLINSYYTDSQSRANFAKQTDHQERDVLVALASSSPSDVTQFLAARATAAYSWDETHVDPSLAIDLAAIQAYFAAETTLAGTTRDHYNAVANLKSKQINDLISALIDGSNSTIARLADAHEDYVRGGLDAAKEYQIDLIEIVRNEAAGTGTVDTEYARRVYHTSYRNATSGPRLEMADAVRDFTIQAAELSRVMAAGDGANTGLAELDRQFGLAQNLAKYLHAIGTADASQALDVARAEARSTQLDGLYLQSPTSLVESDLYLAGIDLQAILSGNNYQIDLLAALTARNEADTAVTTDFLASPGQIAAAIQEAIDEANEAYNDVAAQIQDENNLGTSYSAPWIPQPMSPFNQFSSALGLPEADALVYARIAFNPNPGSPRYYGYSNWGSYLGNVGYFFGSGYYGDAYFWGGGGYSPGVYGYQLWDSYSYAGYGYAWGDGYGYDIDFSYFAGGYSYGALGSWFLTDLNLNVTIPNRTLTAPTLAIGQNQFNNWWGWGWNQTRMDALAGIEPNSQYLDKLVPGTSPYPTYQSYSNQQATQPTLPNMLAAPTLIDRGIRGESSNRLEGVLPTAHNAAKNSLAGTALADVGMAEQVFSKLWSDTWSAAYKKYDEQVAAEAAKRIANRRPADPYDVSTATFWDGMLKIAKGEATPTFLIQWNKQHATSVSYNTTKNNYKNGTINLANATLFQAADRVSELGYDPSIRSSIGTVYNEGFHAWLDGVGSQDNTKWLLDYLSEQKQLIDTTSSFETLAPSWFVHFRGQSHEVKAEEAMSNVIDKLVSNYLSSGRPVPTYQEMLRDNKDALTPGHNDSPDEPFYGDPTASIPISEQLYYATIWLMYNGNKDPLQPASTAVGYHRFPEAERELEIKRFFAQSFRPQWSPEEVRLFTAVEQLLLDYNDLLFNSQWTK